jgi:hypothetical protein
MVPFPVTLVEAIALAAPVVTTGGVLSTPVQTSADLTTPATFAPSEDEVMEYHPRGPALV